MFHGKGLISKKAYDAAYKACSFPKTEGRACNTALDAASEEVGPHNIYDICECSNGRLWAVAVAVAAALTVALLRTDDNCPETERWLQITGKSMRWLRNTVRARMATHGPAAHAVLHDELTVKMGGGYDWGCNGMQDMADFFRRSDVQAALHLGKPGVSSFGYESSGPASITLYPELVTKMRVLIYNGDSDACVPCKRQDIAESGL